MNKKALFNLSYGMYVIATNDGGKNVGCVVNTVTQISANPVSLALSTNLDNYTTNAIMQNGRFTVSVLSENVPPDTIGVFGFSSSKDANKFDRIKFKTLASGLPVLTEGVCAFLECRVINHVDCYTHKIIIADVLDAENLSGEKPMTYGYYHQVIKGVAPKNAATYIEPESRREEVYKCNVCGYVYPGENKEFEALPDTYKCPVCGAPKREFSLVAVG